MESHPQNPEFRNNHDNFLQGRLKKKKPHRRQRTMILQSCFTPIFLLSLPYQIVNNKTIRRVDQKIKFIKTVPDHLFRPSSPFQ